MNLCKLTTCKLAVRALCPLVAPLLLAACSGILRPVAEPIRTAIPDTGHADLNAIIVGALRNDPGALRPYLSFLALPCTKADGLGGPPCCRDGEADGTVVRILPLLGREGHFLREDELADWPGIQVSELMAVYRVSDAAYGDEVYPAGACALRFAGVQEQTTVTLQVKEGRIVRMDFGFGSLSAVRAEDVDRYLIPPRTTQD